MSRFILKYNRKCLVILMLGLFCSTAFHVMPVRASMEEALSAARNRNFDQAFKLFLDEATRGNPEAQYRLAGMYKSGQGTRKNHEQALQWYKKSAQQGHVKARKKLVALEKKTQNSDVGINRELALFKAVRKGDKNIVASLLLTDIDINYQDKFGGTALMEAARLGQGDITDMLLEKGADPNLYNKDDDTALLIAVAQNNMAVVKLLLDHGADINSRDHLDCTPLIRAVLRENIPIVEYLLSKKADIFIRNRKGRMVYDVALGLRNKKLIALIEQSGGAKLAGILSLQNKKRKLKQLTSQTENIQKRGWTPVMYGVWRGDERAVAAALTTTAANLEYRDKAGMTALSLAAQGGHLDIFYMLLAAGASLDCQKVTNHPFTLSVKEGHRPLVHRLLPAMSETASCQTILEESLNYALLNGREDIADLLLKTGVSYGNAGGQSPLVLMAAKADNHLVSRLVNSGIDVNAVDEYGQTALMLAARHCNLEGIKSLIRHGANLEQRDKSGQTALIHAARNGHISCTRYLSRAGANTTWATREGNTALMLAAEKGHAPVVSFLSQYNNLDQKNMVGDTALIMAARSGSYETLEILLQKGANPRIRNNKREKPHSVVDAKNTRLFALLKEYEASRSWLQDIF